MIHNDERKFVSVMTERGRIVGAVHKMGEGRSADVMWVHHISSGSIVTCPVASARPATPDEIQTMWEHVDLVDTLHESERSFAGELASTVNDKRIQGFVDMAKRNGLSVTEAGGFIKFTSNGGDRSIYLSKNCRRIDLSGFSVEDPLIKQVSETEAKWRRLGRVRSQAVNIPDDELDYLWATCFSKLMDM